MDAGDMSHDTAKDLASSENHSTQAWRNRPTMEHSETSSEETPSSDGMDQISSVSSLTSDITSNVDNHPLVPEVAMENFVPSLRHSSTPLGQVAGSALPVCNPPSLSPGRLGWSPLQSVKSSGNFHLQPPSTSMDNSQHSLKSTAAQIEQVAGDDCCVHCVLACLFCELLSLCSIVTHCLACGRDSEVLCCCGGEGTAGMACGEEACCAALDCGILEDCCESSDCLEICLECCSICFPA